jgi:hypothetical protein
MKLQPEQLVDWFFTANPLLAEGRDRYLAMLQSPPPGTRRSEVIAGLKQGINDTLTMAKEMSEEQRKQIDSSLLARGLPSLRKMQAGLTKIPQRILARGHIRNDEEFYIVAEILADASFEVSAAEREVFGKMSCDYEFRTKGA